MSENKTNISLVIPCYNEELNIDSLVDSLNRYSAEHIELAIEVIFVDDCSTDGTYEKLRTAPHREYTCRILKLSTNCGSHVAFRAGCKYASNDLVTLTSSDLQHPLNLIHECLKSLESNNVDCVIAIRGNDYYDSFIEKRFSRFYTWLVRKFAVSTFPAGGFDIFMIGKRYKDLMNSNIEGNSSIYLQILSVGLPFNSIVYNKEKRHKGKSKWTISKKVKLMIDTFIAFSFAPIRLVTIMGIALFFLGIMLSVYLLLRKIFVGDLIQGWALAYSTILCGFGVTNISLGIIAEYLWRTLDASRKRPVFVVDRDEEIR